MTQNASVFLQNVTNATNVTLAATHDVMGNSHNVTFEANESEAVADYTHHVLLDLYSQPHIVLKFILSTLAVVCNVISVMALSRTRRSLKGSQFRMIVSLALSDILIGLTVVCFTINLGLNPTPYPGTGPPHKRLSSRCTFTFLKALNCTGLNVTLLNLVGMAVDHYIAILKPFEYGRLMSRKRSRTMIVVVWVVATLCGFSDYFSAYPKYLGYENTYNFCEFIFLTQYQEEYMVFAIALLCFITMSIIYVKIYIEVKRHKNRNPEQAQYLKNKKALFTTLLILGAFVLCWAPTCFYQTTLVAFAYLDVEWLMARRHTLITVDKYLFDLLLVNALLDPVIYAVRMKEVRLGYMKLFCREKEIAQRRRNSCDTSAYTSICGGPNSRKASRVSSNMGLPGRRPSEAVTLPSMKNSSV